MTILHDDYDDTIERLDLNISRRWRLLDIMIQHRTLALAKASTHHTMALQSLQQALLDRAKLPEAASFVEDEMPLILHRLMCNPRLDNYGYLFLSASLPSIVVNGT